MALWKWLEISNEILLRLDREGHALSDAEVIQIAMEELERMKGKTK